MNRVLLIIGMFFSLALPAMEMNYSNPKFVEAMLVKQLAQARQNAQQNQPTRKRAGSYVSFGQQYINEIEAQLAAIREYRK